MRLAEAIVLGEGRQKQLPTGEVKAESAVCPKCGKKHAELPGTLKTKCTVNAGGPGSGRHPGYSPDHFGRQPSELSEDAKVASRMASTKGDAKAHQFAADSHRMAKEAYTEKADRHDKAGIGGSVFRSIAKTHAEKEAFHQNLAK